MIGAWKAKRGVRLVIEFALPGRDMKVRLRHLLLDVNGTLTLDGRIIPGVKERIQMLREQLDIHLLTADTFGRGAEVAAELGTAFRRMDANHAGLDKKAYLALLGAENTAAIGNGYNDIHMLGDAALGIAVIGPEGCAAYAIQKSDVVVNDINAALDLLLNPKRLLATLRA
jgi:P-type E1-E2 ATPase